MFSKFLVGTLHPLAPPTPVSGYGPVRKARGHNGVLAVKFATWRHIKTLLDTLRHMQLFAIGNLYRGADKSLARPGRKQGTAIEDFEFHISYL
jgi:hypothetical protein